MRLRGQPDEQRVQALPESSRLSRETRRRRSGRRPDGQDSKRS